MEAARWAGAMRNLTGALSASVRDGRARDGPYDRPTANGTARGVAEMGADGKGTWRGGWE